MGAQPATIVITGASRGIGRAIALRAAQEKVQLVLVARDLQALEEVGTQVQALGAPAPNCHAFDITDSGQIQQLFGGILKQYGRLDGLVNNAGVLHEGLLGMIPAQDIDRVFNINIRAPLMFMQYASRLMRRQKSGSIVNLASIMGTQGAAGLSVYAASKAAIIGATRSAAKELAELGIRVNAIAPGFIDTDMTREMPESAHAARLAQIGMKRPGAPEEVADLCWFLLSPQSAYISGQTISIDGQMGV
ncbi:3-oxoacyl-ACP reductase [Lysobacteraceae bacterium NML75-0749]|nr:3-oxoacyl-ACP reductase [Xanthomonadaceae bacterium NML75-0749]PJK04890.1 3-oxoacyl-ACP reductase [Xanthomonadaceae bacterium NML91-0268]PJK05241.1 3-oxoacyl-ACP reductase [Xanthomonadaceae bacterium NML71-0210]